VTVFFTSDLHLGHRKAAEHRGFEHPHEHDAVICENWHATVKADDDVWVLGDLAASSPIYALGVLGALPGRKHLISGNHDKTHPMFRDAHKHLRAYMEVFESVASAGRRRINGREVLLSHFPYRRDRGEARHLQWRLRDEGAWLLHGHTHGAETISPLIREVHVGVDAWQMTPVALETVGALIDAAEAAKDWRMLARRNGRPVIDDDGPADERCDDLLRPTSTPDPSIN
jgi:calcineurin-like phosphoesterase family protein